MTPATEQPATSHATPPGGERVLQRLLNEGWRFDFAQAVWLLERCWGRYKPVGGRGPAASEGLRFRPDTSLGFPASDVRQISRLAIPGSDQFVHLIECTFLGLYGVSTPLPLHYAVDLLRAVEQAQARPAEALSVGGLKMPPEQAQTVSAPQRDFLDLLHHRLTSLFYRACNKYRYDRTFGMPERDTITDYMLYLIGLHPSWDRKVLGVEPVRLLRYAGVLSQHPRSAATLEGVLLDYWKGRIPIRVEQFLGRWVALSPSDLNSIGMTNCRLGMDLTVGEEVYDLSGAFKIVVGPVGWATYVSFLPDGWRFAETRSLVQLYGADPLALTIEIVLDPEQVPEMRLDSSETAGRLGFTSWPRAGQLSEASVTFDATSSSTWEFTAMTTGTEDQDWLNESEVAATL